MDIISTNEKRNNLIDTLRNGFFSSNQLKLFALIAMTFDHIGCHILDNYIPFRVIGRLAFPVFAYMIAEGCRYTKHKLKYLLSVFLTGTICQTVYTIAMDKWNMNIFITFSLSIAIIYSIQWAKESYDNLSYGVPAFAIMVTLFITMVIPKLYEGTFKIDYGFFGVMVPVITSLSDKKLLRLLLFTLGMIFLCIDLNPIQWWSMLGVIPVALYNGKRGKLKLKYFFYGYYPVHLVIIYSIGELLH